MIVLICYKLRGVYLCGRWLFIDDKKNRKGLKTAYISLMISICTVFIVVVSVQLETIGIIISSFIAFFLYIYFFAVAHKYAVIKGDFV